MCDPNSVETAKLLAKDTKPCPKCASMIYKVSGCDLMFCTMCHVSFSWKTGRQIETNNNHNPHYLEFVRRTNNGIVPRAPGDIPLACGGFPTYWVLDEFTKRNMLVDQRMKYVMNVQRIFGHILEYEVQENGGGWRTNNRDNLDVNQDFRVQYLLNEITEENWKRDLQKRETKREVVKARKQVYEMLVTVGSALLNKLVVQGKKNKESIDTLNEMQNLFDYFNASIVAVDKRFGLRISRLFTNDWKWEKPAVIVPTVAIAYHNRLE